MPTVSSEPALDAQVFWFRYRREIVAVLLVAIAALIGWTAIRFFREKHDADAAAFFSSAKDAGGYQQVINRFPGTPAAASAYLLLAKTQRKEGKFADANASLRSFLDKFPNHELAMTARMAIAANLESLGKTDEALTLYQQIGAVPGNFNAPYAMIAQARILQARGKSDETKRILETIMTQHRESYASLEAAQMIRSLKPAASPSPTPAVIMPAISPTVPPTPNP